MFNTPYKFRYCDKKTKNIGEFMFTEHKLTFICRHNHQYIVNVEEYPYEVFILKFHLKNHTSSPNKYKLLTQINDPFRVLSTCLNILHWFFTEKAPYGNFGFIGENLIGEGKSDTKRFRIYRQIMADKFSIVEFQHFISKKHSMYMMVSRNRLEKNGNILKEIENMFKHIYIIEK